MLYPLNALSSTYALVVIEKMEGTMFHCLMPKISHILRGEKAKHHCCLGKESINITNERLERIIQRNLYFILKTLQGSRKKVDERVQNGA